MREQFTTLARYNRWANRRVYEACAALSDADYRRPRPAFFGSIHGTLNHLLAGDRVWLGRFGWILPRFIIRIAPACSGMSVYIEWMKQISSTTLPTHGKMSLTHLPHFPCCRNENGDFSRPFFVFRSDLRSTIFGRWPARLAISPGLSCPSPTGTARCSSVSRSA